ncbi:MAG TPA: DUF1292 domain-containing protein [Firmicutes bacterium]|nr:DUF1292 domain-containing protein [Bacillota bacterium]
MHELPDELVTLVDEEGHEHEFMLLDIIMVNDHEYAIMLPVSSEEEDAAEEEQEAIVFRIDDSDGEQSLTVVEDDEEWEAVAAAWEEMAVREFDEWDDEE